MRSHSVHPAGIVCTWALLLAAPSTTLAQAHEQTAVATTPHFAFHSDFATNLNDALIAAGVARNGGEPELFSSGAEASCFGDQPPSTRAGWDRAVDYYAEIISPADFGDRQQFLIRLHLLGFDEELSDSESQRLLSIASAFRAAATPAYEACRWADQDAENRRWIEALTSQLAAHEQRIASRLGELYQQPWAGLPIRVDAVETVSWSGANTIFLDPAGGHLLISNSYQGHGALEIVFHEASHIFMGRGAPVRRALSEASSALDLPPPSDLWHVLLFHTTGEVVRRSLEEAGEPEYTPILHEIYQRSPWVRYRDAIESTWPAYMNGELRLSEAAANLIRAIGGREKPE